jgi:hypothetical protein
MYNCTLHKFLSIPLALSKPIVICIQNLHTQNMVTILILLDNCIDNSDYTLVINMVNKHKHYSQLI